VENAGYQKQTPAGGPAGGGHVAEEQPTEVGSVNVAYPHRSHSCGAAQRTIEKARPLFIRSYQLSTISTDFRAINTSATTLTSRVERYAECSGFHRGGGGSSFQGSCDFSNAEFFLRKALQSMNFSCSPRTRLRNHGRSLLNSRLLIDIARR
jgi:hypothetical protein